ncbi:MAG: APC family permease [Pirellula sp.]|nr:APC family permease [Pirellula sp.]
MNQKSQLPAVDQPHSGNTSLGLVSLVCLVIGNMIGVGVYVSAGYALSDLRDARYVLIVWAIAGVHAMCGAVAYAAVAKRFSVSGGEYAILSRWAHPSLGFVAGWVSIFAGFAAPIAAAAIVFADYALKLNTADGSQSSSVQWLAITVVVVAALSHWIEIKWNAWVNNLIIALKFVGIAVFIGFGLRWILSGNGSDGILKSPDASILSNQDLIWLALGSFFYTTLAYTGFNASIYLAGANTNDLITSTNQPISHKETNAEEHVTPNLEWNRLIAKSMILACGIVTVIYLALNAIFMYSIPADKLTGAGDRFVGEVAIAIGGNWFGQLTSWLIILSTGTSVLAMMMTGPHVYLQLARDLGWASKLSSERTKTRLAITIQTIIACVIIMFSNLSDTISYLGLTLTACGGLAIASMWIAQFKGEFREKLHIQWWEHLCAAIYVLGALTLLVIAFMRPEQHMKFVWSMMTFLAGLVVYGIFRSLRHK